MFKQLLLLTLLLCWFVITMFQSWRVGKLMVENDLFRIQLSNRETELKYCLSEIKRLVVEWQSEQS